MILVVHHHEDGCAEGFALERAGENADPVGLIAGGDDFGLPGAATVEVRLDIGLVQFQLRRTAVEHDTDSAPVGFAPGRDSKQVAKSVWHALIVRENAAGGKSPIK